MTIKGDYPNIPPFHNSSFETRRYLLDGGEGFGRTCKTMIPLPVR